MHHLLQWQQNKPLVTRDRPTWCLWMCLCFFDRNNLIITEWWKIPSHGHPGTTVNNSTVVFKVNQDTTNELVALGHLLVPDVCLSSAILWMSIHMAWVWPSYSYLCIKTDLKCNTKELYIATQTECICAIILSFDTKDLLLSINGYSCKDERDNKLFDYLQHLMILFLENVCIATVTLGLIAHKTLLFNDQTFVPVAF